MDRVVLRNSYARCYILDVVAAYYGLMTNTQRLLVYFSGIFMPELVHLEIHFRNIVQVALNASLWSLLEFGGVERNVGDLFV